LKECSAEAVIHCEHPWDTADWAHVREIRQAVEVGLVNAVGADPEPEREIFAPGRLHDVLREMPSDGLRVLALNDMCVPEPATRDAAIDVFRRSDRDIDMTVGNRANLVRVAVLVRTADKFSGLLEFNAKARLRNWYLLRVPKCNNGTYSSDPDNVGFIKQQISHIKNLSLAQSLGETT
jgi:hypothetical protein